MAKRFFTVLVLPDPTAVPKKVHLSHPMLTGLAVGLMLGLGLLGVFLHQYLDQRGQLRELRQLRQAAADQAALTTQWQHVHTALARLRDLDQQVRTAVGLDHAPPDLVPPLAQGGEDAGSHTALATALRQRASQAVAGVRRDLPALNQEVTTRAQSLRELLTFLDAQAALRAAAPSILPVKGLITAGFGPRVSPITGQREFHEGLDIAAPYGTPIVATADGVVTYAGPLVAYGNVVFLDHGQGFQTFYGHNSSNRVREGQRVRRGETIAFIGTSGNATGPHVHYEVHVRGVIVNPLKYAIDTSGVTVARDVKVDSPS